MVPVDEFLGPALQACGIASLAKYFRAHRLGAVVERVNQPPIRELRLHPPPQPQTSRHQRRFAAVANRLRAADSLREPNRIAIGAEIRVMEEREAVRLQ